MSLEKFNEEIDALIAEADAEKEEYLKGEDDDSTTYDLDNDNSDLANKDAKDEESDAGNKEEDKEDSNSEEEKDEANTDAGKEQQFDPVEVEVSGYKVKLDSQEKLDAYNSKKDKQDIIKTVNKSKEELMLEQGNLSDEDLQLLIDAKNGNASAIKKLAEKSNIDLADADEADDYKPEFEVKAQSDIDAVLRGIEANEPLVKQMNEVTANLPEDFQSAIMSSGAELKAFAEQVHSGVAQELLQVAAEMTATNNNSLLENYVLAGQAKMQSMQKNQSKESAKEMSNKEQEKRDITSKEKLLRDRAKSGDVNNGGKKETSNLTENDIWNMNFEDIENLDLHELK